MYSDAEWDAMLEARMRALSEELDVLVCTDIRQRENSLIRGYLHRARYALRDAVGWYEFFRTDFEAWSTTPRKVTPKRGI